MFVVPARARMAVVLVVCLVGGLLAAVPPAPAHAAPVLGGHLYATGGDVLVEGLPASSAYTSELWLFEPGTPRLVMNSRETGRKVNLGRFDLGAELVFGIKVRNTGQTFKMGAGDRNPDGLIHAAVETTTAGSEVGFEDLYGGGDRDYDDVRFLFTGGIDDARSGELPIIFLPGTGGTTLENESGRELFPASELTALNPFDRHFDVLALEGDGSTACCEPVVPGHVTKKVVTEDIYASTFDVLEAQGYVEGENLFAFPYDWRKSQQHNATKLASFIREVKAETGASQVNILAHSLGGLVTETAIETSEATALDVNRVVTLGSPHLGVAQVLGQLKYEAPCQFALKIVFERHCMIDQAEISRLYRNWPGLLSLLPGRNYVQAVGAPIERPWDDGSSADQGPLTYDDYRDELRGFNDELIASSMTWHDSHDGWAPAADHVGLLRILSDSYPTIGSIKERQVEQCREAADPWGSAPVCEDIVVPDFRYLSGDSMVVRESASLFDFGSRFDLRGDGINAFVNRQDHVFIAKSASTLGFAVAYLEGTGPNGRISTSARLSAASYDNAAAAPLALAAEPGDGLPTMPDGISLTPGRAVGTEVSIVGPVTGVITDATGRRTGVKDLDLRTSESGIPHSSYNAGTGFASTVLPVEGAYAASWRAVSSGDARIAVRSYDDGTVTSLVAFPPVRVRVGTTVAAAIDSESDEMKLRVDDDGDGNVDRVVKAFPRVVGAHASDVMAPVSTVEVTSADGVKDIVLDASDSGAGVAYIEYLVGRTGKTSRYTGALRLPAEGDVYFRAVDLAGNVERYNVLNLDDHADGARAVRTFAEPHINVGGHIGYAGDEDWLGITLSAGTTKVQLVGMAQNYDIDIIDSTGATVARGAEAGNRSERLDVTVGKSSRYYVRVSSATAEWSTESGYRLNITAAR